MSKYLLPIARFTRVNRPIFIVQGKVKRIIFFTSYEAAVAMPETCFAFFAIPLNTSERFFIGVVFAVRETRRHTDCSVDDRTQEVRQGRISFA